MLQTAPRHGVLAPDTYTCLGRLGRDVQLVSRATGGDRAQEKPLLQEVLRSPMLGEDQSVGHPSVPPGEGHLRLKKDGPMKEGEQKTDRKGVGKEKRPREAERNRKTEKQRWREM